MALVIVSLALMSAGVALLSKAGGIERSLGFSAPFAQYVERRCRVVSFDAFVDLTSSHGGGCYPTSSSMKPSSNPNRPGPGRECIDGRIAFVGVAGVTLSGDDRVYAAVVQVPNAGRTPSTEAKEDAVNATFVDFFPLQVGDSVLCGVPPQTVPLLLSKVERVPTNGLVALNFNARAAAADRRKVDDLWIAGGVCLGLAPLFGCVTVVAALCLFGCCKSTGSGSSRRSRERDFVEGTLSRNTCDYGCINWLGWCCFRLRGGTFVEEE